MTPGRILIPLIALLMCPAGRCGAAGPPVTPSLYGYTGYLMTPGAYVRDGRVGLHYSFFPSDAAPMRRHDSDNWLFTSTLGFLPFMELYMSVYVLPDTDPFRGLDEHYGAAKVRSPGVKLRILDERGRRPALAVGLFDPNLRRFGLDASYSNVSSTFAVISKRIERINGSVSLGYGAVVRERQFTRLAGLFGGLDMWFGRWVGLAADYDADRWAAGMKARWRGLGFGCAVVEGSSFVYRLGYTFDWMEDCPQ